LKNLVIILINFLCYVLNSHIVEGHLKVEPNKCDLYDLVVIADERVEDTADVRRVELRTVDRAECATRSSVALEHDAFAV